MPVRAIEKQNISALKIAGDFPLREDEDLGRRLGAGRADVGVADVLAAGALGPGLPQSTLAGQVDSPGLAPLTHRAQTDALERHWYYPLPADTMRSW